MELLRQSGMIASLRGMDRDRLDKAARQLYEGGIRAFEVPLNTVGAFYLIKDLRKELGKKAFVGAGAILDAGDAKAALEAGASFLSTPGIDKRVIQFGGEENIPVYAGGVTPTEVMKAWKYGPAGVRLYPAGPMGPDYALELKRGLGHIPLIAAGGIRRSQAADYIRAGCEAVCLDCIQITGGDTGGEAARKAASLAEEIRTAQRALQADEILL